MTEQKSKSSQLTHWAAHHAAWEFTGAGVVHFIKEEIKAYLRPFLGGSVITGGIAYGLNHLGVIGPWLIVTTLVTFGIVLFAWDLIAKSRLVVAPEQRGEHAKELVALAKASDNSPLSEEEKIKITLPLDGEALTGEKRLGPNSVSYAVHGTLKSLPADCEIWLITTDKRTRQYWPQGFADVHYDRPTGTWRGEVHSGRSPLQVVAVVAPPTSQQLFRYYQKLGDLRQQKNESKPWHQPLDAIPAECRNVASVNTQEPWSSPVSQGSGTEAHTPVLRYDGVFGEPFFMLTGLGLTVNPQIMHISNIQTDVLVTANNVRASIEYLHADRERFVVREALWLEVPGIAEFVKSVHIPSAKTARLCIFNGAARRPLHSRGRHR